MSLHSKTNLKLIDAIGEGPIEGLVHHRKGVFLDETAVTFEQTKKNIVIRQREGSPEQLQFEEGLFANAATEIQAIGRQIGRNYEEKLNNKT